MIVRFLKYFNLKSRISNIFLKFTFEVKKNILRNKNFKSVGLSPQICCSGYFTAEQSILMDRQSIVFDILRNTFFLIILKSTCLIIF